AHPFGRATATPRATCLPGPPLLPPVYADPAGSIRRGVPKPAQGTARRKPLRRAPAEPLPGQVDRSHEQIERACFYLFQLSLQEMPRHCHGMRSAPAVPVGAGTVLCAVATTHCSDSAVNSPKSCGIAGAFCTMTLP